MTATGDRPPSAALPASVEWVNLTFVDIFGLAHAVAIPAGRFAGAVESGELIDGSAVEGRARRLETDMLLRPDPSTICCGDGPLARAICNVVRLDGSPWPADPRTALEDLIGRAGELACGWTASAELEFYLLDGDGRPIDRGGYFDEIEGLGMRTVREAASLITSCGGRVDACHLEAGPGQYEIDLAPAPPLRLADSLVLARQLVREVAAAHGLRATFMARPWSGEPGSGLHLHQRSPALLAADGKLTDVGAHFVAGQLACARALCALAAPNVNSYKRLHSGPEAPGAVVWAHTNRAALIRVSTAAGETASIEFRGADPCANPYLLTAALLTAGRHGVEAALPLPPPVEEDGLGFDFARPDSIRFDPLPRGLGEALDALAGDDVLVDAFHHDLLHHLSDARRAEIEAYASVVTTWERERFLDEP